VKSKRPWKKYVKIERVEMNNGDVQFWSAARGNPEPKLHQTEDRIAVRIHAQTLDEVETGLNAWWADWWPKQVKSSRRA
jgi:hypothetical protein